MDNNYVVLNDIINDKLIIKNLKHSMDSYLYKSLNMSKEDFIIKDCYYNNMPVYYFSMEVFFENPDILLKKSVEKLIEINNDLIGSDIEIELSNKTINIFFNNHDYTLLNTLSKYIELDDNVSLCNYNKPHVLEKKFIMTIKLKAESNDFKKIIKNGIFKIINNLKTIKYL